MVPDSPEASDYPASPWQTVGLITLVIVVFLLAVWGGFDLVWRVSPWFDQ